MAALANLRLGLYEKGIPLSLDWDRKFETARAAGFDFIEFSIDGMAPRIHRLKLTGRELEQIRAASIRHAMPFQTMALTANRYFPLGDPDRETRLTGKAIVKRAIEMAELLGLSLIQVAAYDVNGKNSTEETRAAFWDALAELLEYSGHKSITLAVEVLEDVPHFSTIRQGRTYMEAFSHPYLKLYADIGNVASIGVDPAADLACGRGLIAACHIKDALPGSCRNVPYGTGIVDFDRCMQAFREMAFDGVFVAEVWSDEDEGFIPYLSETARFIRNKMNEKENLI